MTTEMKTETNATALENVQNKKDWVDLNSAQNNPNIDAELIKSFQKLIKPLKKITLIGNGTDYNLSHPFESNYNG